MTASIDWTLIASAAAALSAIAAAMSAYLSLKSILVTRSTAAEQRAADAVKKYLELAIQNPKYSAASKEDQYDWFVSFLLMTVRDILEAHKNDKSWELFVANQLDWFRSDLVAWKKWDSEKNTNYLKHFGPDVERVVNQCVARQKAA